MKRLVVKSRLLFFLFQLRFSLPRVFQEIFFGCCKIRAVKSRLSPLVKQSSSQDGHFGRHDGCLPIKTLLMHIPQRKAHAPRPFVLSFSTVSTISRVKCTLRHIVGLTCVSLLVGTEVVG